MTGARFRQVYGGKWRDGDNGDDSFGLSFDGQFYVSAELAGVDITNIPAAELKRMVLACIEHLSACGEWE